MDMDMIFDARDKRVEALVNQMIGHLAQHGTDVPFVCRGFEIEVCQQALTEVCRRTPCLNAELYTYHGLPAVRFVSCSRI